MEDYRGLTLKCSGLLFFLPLSFLEVSACSPITEKRLKRVDRKTAIKKKFKLQEFSSILKCPTVLCTQSKGD